MVLLVTDLHFGVKNNSMTWWKSQEALFRKQLIPEVKAEYDRGAPMDMIVLGDVFDSRSSISVFIMHEVKKLFVELAGYVKNIYIIAGNHDTYTEQSSKYCSLDIILDRLCDNIKVISQAPEEVTIDGVKCVMIPWHSQKEKSITEWSAENRNAVIFTHADIMTGEPKLYCPVFSGHIHTPYNFGNRHNLGSCFPLTFADADSERAFYFWDPKTGDLSAEVNKVSIRFYRVRNEEIMNKAWDKLKPEDYVEIYIRYSLLQDPAYQNKCTELKAAFRNLHIIPVPDDIQHTDAVDVDMDIEEVIEQMLPEELSPLFNLLKSRINDECTE